MGIASQGDGTGKGSSGHEAKGVKMGGGHESAKQPSAPPKPGTRGNLPPWMQKK